MSTTLAENFLVTAPNAQGIKFLVRKPRPPAPEPEPEAAADASAATESVTSSKRVRLSKYDICQNNLQELAANVTALKSRLAAVSSQQYRLQTSLQAYKAENDRLKDGQKNKNKRKHTSPPVNYRFVSEAFAKFLNIDANTGVLRQDITSHYSAYVRENNLSRLVTETDAAGKEKTRRRTVLDDNLRALLGPETSADIDTGKIALNNFSFNHLMSKHFREERPPVPSAEQQGEICAVRPDMKFDQATDASK